MGQDAHLLDNIEPVCAGPVEGLALVRDEGGDDFVENGYLVGENEAQ
jgi:hypothetical protein